MSMSTIDRLYSSLINDIDYKDLPETEKARDKVKACIMGGYLSKDNEEARKQWLELEKIIADIKCIQYIIDFENFGRGFRPSRNSVLPVELIFCPNLFRLSAKQ